MISVLIPLHNGQEYLDDCLSSVLAQTFTKFEILVGLNGLEPVSIRSAIEKIQSFNDTRVRAVLCKKSGKVNALNTLVSVARHQYLALLDVDDKWLPTKLHEQIPHLRNHDVIGSGFQYFGEAEGSPSIFLGKLTLPMFSYQNPVVCSSVLMKRDDAHWEEKWEGLEDYQKWVVMMRAGKKFFNVPKVLVEHRIHSDSYYNTKNSGQARKFRMDLPLLTEDEKYELDLKMDKAEWDL